MVKLKHLTESLNNKYITEAFGDTFPKWFKDALADSRKYYGKRNLSTSDRHGGAIDVGIEPDKAKGPKPKLTQPKGFKGDIETLSLFNQAREAGLDFQNTQITEAPVPTSTKDPIMKDASIVRIWGFPNGQVYVEGINDKEKYAVNDYQFAWFSPKKLIDTASHFAYFSGTELKPSLYYDKELERHNTYSAMDQMYREHPEMINMNRGSDRHFAKLQRYDPETRADITWGTYAKDKLDKSGYLVSPKRYADALKKAKAGRAYGMLSKIHTQLENLYEDYLNALDNVDESDLNTVDFPYHALSNIKKLAVNYNALAKEASEIAEFEGGEKQFRLQNLMENIEKIDWDKEINDIQKSFIHSIDWLI